MTSHTVVGVDWGTTTLRAWLIVDGIAIESVHERAGVRDIPAGMHAATLTRVIAPWLDQAEAVIAAGMVGSTLGWMETPFCPAPVGLLELASAAMPVPSGLPRPGAGDVPVWLIPGVDWSDGDRFEVIRGEETQALAVAPTVGTVVVVLPGTHSKWITVTDGRIAGIRSYLTGELFELLTVHSTLAECIVDPGRARIPAPDEGPSPFMAACAVSPAGLLNGLFGIRGAWLHGQDPHSNREYLSGLLIGAEVADAAQHVKARDVLLMADGDLYDRYAQALGQHEFTARHRATKDITTALWTVAMSRLKPKESDD
jgi:2-dehydro-3-deoxygalactonokinase